LNASAALVVSGKATNLAAGIQQAKNSVTSGKAMQTLDKLIALSNSLE
jgi:anthranilate phosphoribosyltransferase